MYNENIFKHIEKNKMSVIVDSESNTKLSKSKDYAKYKKFLIIVDKPKTDGNYPTKFSRQKGVFEHSNPQKLVESEGIF